MGDVKHVTRLRQQVSTPPHHTSLGSKPQRSHERDEFGASLSPLSPVLGIQAPPDTATIVQLGLQFSQLPLQCCLLCAQAPVLLLQPHQCLPVGGSGGKKQNR